MIKLSQIVMNRGDESEIYRKIRDFWNQLFFDYLEEVAKEPLNNDKSALIDAIKKGKITYSDGVFHFERISNKVATTLEEMGAVYSRHLKGYILRNIPTEIAQAVSLAKISRIDKVEKIKNYLDDLMGTKEYAQDRLNFEPEIRNLEKKLNGQLVRSLKRINVIPAELTPFQVEQIAKNYTENMKFYIKKWTDREIINLRKDVEKYALGGMRAENLKEIIKQHKGVSERKARFLARQETKLMVAEYRKNRFKENGVTKYVWSTVLDGRERELHRQLNGKVFSWDNPPIIDANTGERGNAGEAYNCRCTAIPVVDDDFWR